MFEEFGYIGAGWNSGWTAFFDYFDRLKLDIIRHSDWESWRRLVRSGIWDCILFRGAAILCRRPAQVLRDDRNRLHCTTGPAVRWLDGYSNFFVHGITVEPEAVLRPEGITRKRLLGEQNIEVRRTLIDLMGPARFVEVLKPKVLDKDADASGMPRRLLRCESPGDEPVVLVEVKCPSTGKVAHLRVPPEMERCSQAVAWTFGIEVPDQYRPLVEA